MSRRSFFNIVIGGINEKYNILLIYHNKTGQEDHNKNFNIVIGGINEKYNIILIS
jgi:hypothetical protein